MQSRARCIFPRLGATRCPNLVAPIVFRLRREPGLLPPLGGPR